MDALLNDDNDRKILEEALKDETILKALGPLSENWFEDLNEKFVQEIFDDSFTSPCVEDSHGDDEILHDRNLLKAVTELENAQVSRICESTKSETTIAKIPEKLSSCNLTKESDPNFSTSNCFSLTTSVKGKNIEKTVILEDQRVSFNRNLKSIPFLRQKTALCKPSKLTYDNITQKVSDASDLQQQHSKKRKSFDIKTENDEGRFKESIFGFTTASQKPLSYSSESLKKAKLLLEGIDKFCTDDNETNHKSAEGVSSLTTCSFKTASNKPMSISASALNKANILLASVSESSKVNLNTPFKQSSSKEFTKAADLQTTGFKTASNRFITVSSAAWEKGKNIFESLESNPTNNLQSTVQKEPTPNSKNESFSNNHPKTQRRFSFGGSSSLNSTLYNTSKAKRRNSLYKPPRRTPLKEIHNRNDFPKVSAQTNKKLLGVKHDQESQIFVSDESLLKAMALFEQA